MGKPSDSSEVELVPCNVCRKEIPLSAALVSEAADYVVHFCGLDCYEKWKGQSKPAKKQSGKTGQ